ncbi:MAG: hypothetical protein ACKVOO_07515 [Burkholderiaceae bacterium]
MSDLRSDLHSINSFSQLSEFLRSAVADEESLQMGESIGLLASHVEAMTAQIKGGVNRHNWAALLMDFLTVVRQHKAFVVALSPGWRGLYEYPSYLNALNNFRVLIGQWLMLMADRSAQDPAAARATWPGISDFEAMAWRTIGEGMLMIDMYQELTQRQEEGADPGSALGDLDDSRLELARHWWERLGS